MSIAIAASLADTLRTDELRCNCAWLGKWRPLCKSGNGVTSGAEAVALDKADEERGERRVDVDDEDVGGGVERGGRDEEDGDECDLSRTRPRINKCKSALTVVSGIVGICSANRSSRSSCVIERVPCVLVIPSNTGCSASLTSLDEPAAERRE